MDDVRIHKVSIDHFRGYRSKITFDLSEGTDLTVFEGPNGYGKTSFFDALEWAFTGELYRYASPNEDKRNCNVISFLPFEALAEVKVEFGNNDKIYTIVRSSKSTNADYGANKTKVEVYGEGIKVSGANSVDRFLNDILIRDEYKQDVNFKEVFSRYHMLTQDKMKSFIQEMKGTDRYVEINSLIGNDRYLEYQQIFGEWVKQIKQNIEKLNSEKEGISKEVSIIENQIKTMPTVNIGQASNIDEFIFYIVNQYNLLGERLNLARFDIPKLEKVDLMMLKKFAQHILNQKGTLSNTISNIQTKKNELSFIEVNKSTYTDNKLKITNLEELKTCLATYTELDYCKKNVTGWKDYSKKRALIENELSMNKSKLENLSNYRAVLKEMYEQVNRLKSLDIIESEFDAVDIEQKALAIINWCKVDTCKMNLKGLRLEYFAEPNNILQVGTYEYKLDTQINTYIDINTVFTNAVLLLMQESQAIYDAVKGFKDKYDGIQKNIEIIDSDLSKLSRMDASLRKILNEAESYLTREEFASSDNDICPVCNSILEKGTLLNKIRNQLAEQNTFIKEKVELKNELYKELKQTAAVLEQNKYKYKENLNVFLAAMKQITEQLILIGKIIRDDQDKLLHENQRRIDILDLMSHEISKFDNIVKKYNIDINADDIHIIIENKLNMISERVRLLGYSIETAYAADINTEISEARSQISIFEEKLKEHGIDKDSIDLNIKKMLTDANSSLSDMDSGLTEIIHIEKQLIEMQKYFEMNNKVLELEKLKIKQNETQMRINEQNTVLERIKSLGEAAKVSVEKMTEELLRHYSDNINKIYKRICNHIRFKTFDYKIDRTSQNSSKLNISCYDEGYCGEDGGSLYINPAYIFSSAQVNALAISIFLGMAFSQKCTTLNTILMDDPIQNMDDFNVFAFIDILRSALNEGISTKLSKQIVLSTHDEDVYRLLKKKFRFYKCHSFIYKDYNENGPIVLPG